jgi:ribosomal protein S18 acetylase RimI-like enzyme
LTSAIDLRALPDQGISAKCLLAPLQTHTRQEMMTEFELRAMTIADHPAVLALWSETEGLVLTDTDEREPMQRFLERNPGLSLVAEIDEALVGAVLCSQDGRRGYLHHLAVAPEVRRRGLGSALVQRCLSLLQREGIARCNIFIVEGNESGIAFWRRNGFEMLPHFEWMQCVLS